MSFGRGYAAQFARIDDHLPPSEHDPLIHERIGGLGETPSSSGSSADVLKYFGIGSSLATVAATAMFYTVGGSNAQAAPVQVIVKAVQKGLNVILSTRGFPLLQEDGILGTNTVNAMKANLGKDVLSYTWASVLVELRNTILTLKPTWKPPTVQETFAPEGDSVTWLYVGGGVLLAALLYQVGKK